MIEAAFEGRTSYSQVAIGVLCELYLDFNDSCDFGVERLINCYNTTSCYFGHNGFTNVGEELEQEEKDGVFR